MRIWLAGLLGIVIVGLSAGYLLTGARRSPRRSAAASATEELEADVGRAGPRRVAAAAPSGWRLPAPAPPSSAAEPAPDAATSSAAPLPESPQVDAAVALLERDQQLEAIRTSGPDSEGLLAATGPARDAWTAFTSGGGGNIEVRPWECHRAGCFATAIHGSAQSIEEATSRILASEEIGSWPGAKTRSAPIPRDDGKLEVTWILFAPRDGGVPGR